MSFENTKQTKITKQTKRILFVCFVIFVCFVFSLQPLNFRAFKVLAQQQESGPKRPLITGIAHIAFQVSDLAKARAFYGEMLGYEEPFQIFNNDGSLALTYFKVNDRQYIEVFPGLPPDRDERLLHIAFETSDLEALRVYLNAKGVKVPEKVNQGRDGNLNMTIVDPDGHRVEFVQYRAGSLHLKARGRYVSSRRISDRILHVGITVADVTAADKLYKDILGLSEIWRGGRDETALNWINMKVPDGTDYVEYMLISARPSRQQLGTLHHVALLVPDIQQALETLRGRAPDPSGVRSPQVGRNNRWQLNLYDPDGSRAELMEPFTVR
jgi:catechol 2,3-dioxygenase-like lactoylglutathione lyase family enzyme